LQTSPRHHSVLVPGLARHEIVATLLPLASVFAFLFAFGANRNDLALLSAAVFGLELLLFLSLKSLRQGLSGWNGLLVPATLFLLAAAACAWALTPYTPEGPHPIWTYVQAAPAVAIDRSQVLIGLTKLAGLACCFLIGVLICSSDRRAKLFLRGLVAAAGLYGLWALVAHALSPDAVFGVPNEMHGGRLTGSLFNANAAGTLFGMLLVMTLALLISEIQHGNARVLGLAWRSLLPSAVAAILATCLALTTSRGAFGATVCGILVLVVWTRFARNWRKDTARNILVSIAYLCLAGVLLAAGDVVIDRYATALQDWEAQRTVIYATHWSAFLASPWFGYGLGSFDQVNKLLMTSGNYALLWNVRAAHDVYLQWLEEGGLAGALPMFAATGWVLALVARGAVRRRSNHNKLFLRGLFAASMVVLVHGWSDFSLQIPAIAALWALLLGSGAAVAFSTHENDPAAVQKPKHPSRPFRPAAFVLGCVAIGTVTLMSGAVLFAIIAFPSAPVFVPLAPAFATRADNLLDGKTGPLSPAEITSATDLTDRELAQSPGSASGWLRLAFLKTKTTHKADDDVSALIERSFLVGPLDPDVFAWRTRFALEHWDQVSPAVRDDVMAQLRASWSVWPQKMLLGRLVPSIVNPAGRLALTLAVRQLADQEAAARHAGTLE